MKRLKLKIFASFMLLVAMLAVAGTVSVLEFRRLGRSVHGLIDDNYKTIEAAKTMLEALERQDSGILLLLVGEHRKGRSILMSADKSFLKALDFASNNLSEINEEDYIRQVEENYSQFKARWEDPLSGIGLQENILWYNEIHSGFVDTKNSINALMWLNQESIYRQAAVVGEKSKRAMMPGIVAIISALVFSLLLNFFISRYFVDPISRLSKAINNISQGDTELKCNINSNDEIKGLERAVNNLLMRLNRKA